MRLLWRKTKTKTKQMTNPVRSTSRLRWRSCVAEFHSSHFSNWIHDACCRRVVLGWNHVRIWWWCIFYRILGLWLGICLGRICVRCSWLRFFVWSCSNHSHSTFHSCEDLFDEDTAGLTYDPTMEAGKDDYPYVNIYGSCKTCEAYVLDYFAEQAFESVEEHKKMAVAYMTGAMVGFFVSFLSYITFKVRPQAENEIELLDTNSGVMA